MRNIDARTGIEIMGRDECLVHLRKDVIGRIGVIQGSAPIVLPVNYAMDGDCVVFRTAAGTKLDAGQRSRACFEVDWFDRDRKTGWSVLVAGHLEEVEPYEIEGETQLDVQPWAGGPKEHWMRLRPVRITGRYVREA